MRHQILDFVQMYPAIAYGFIFLLGLSVGSFLNVCIVRLPKEESVVKGRSHCPKCTKMITWYDNIPLLSILLLRGKCRQCGEPISLRYPLVELLTGVMWLGLYRVFGPTVHFFFFTYLVSSLMVATFVDFEHQIIPDEVSLYGVLAGLSMSFLFPALQSETDRRYALADSCQGMLAGIALIWGMAIFGELLFKKESMGGGDLKLLAMIGTFLGFKKTLLTFFIAPLLGAPVGLIFWKLKNTRYIAFGPYLSLAALTALFWGDTILARFLPYYTF